MGDSGQELTIVSNRLPVVMNCDGDSWKVEPGSGGLVQAMNPVLNDNGGRWVGWPGVTTDQGDGWQRPMERVSANSGYDLEPVILEKEEYEGYYEGFANSVLWPLFHGFPDRCNFDPAFYEAYGEVNEKFAQVIADKSDDGLLWVHDYHLLELARRLRQKGSQGRLAYFLHIPFPSVENFSKLPWRDKLLTDLLHFDLIGFQTERDLHHFEQCAGELGISSAVGDRARFRHFELGGRKVEAGAFPIGIDYEGFSKRAATAEVKARVDALKRETGPYQMLLGVDRLDYSKGLIHRLQAYEKALEDHPGLHEEVVLFQLVVPSRENVEEYQALKRKFDRLVGRINGRFSTSSWQPIHYLYNRVSPAELSALYRMASVAVVTPLRDGMNLVSKEFCASQVDEDGVLLLSEFAGAAEQLERGALLVNPYDVDETAQAIYRAIKMPLEQRRQRMQSMREVIEETDVFWWARDFLVRASQRQSRVEQNIVEVAPAQMASPRADQL